MERVPTGKFFAVKAVTNSVVWLNREIQRNNKLLPEMRYSFLPLVSKFVTPHTADEGAVKITSMWWSGPLNI